jgi:hypothetical protein
MKDSALRVTFIPKKELVTEYALGYNKITTFVGATRGYGAVRGE